MSLRTPACRRAVLLTFVLAVAVATPIFAKARAAKKSGHPGSPPASAPARPGSGPAAPAVAPVQPPPAAAAPIAPAVACETSCNDGDPCTVDRCDHTTGQCVHPPVVCDDLSPCTIDSCEAGTGCRFEPVPDGTACPSDFPCQPTGTCQAGQCTLPPVDVVCSDGVPCTYDYCDYQTGQCRHDVNTCDDNNPCTADACDASGQCHHTLLPRGAACDDNNPCTVATSCQEFMMGGLQCVGTPTPEAACSDGNPCTVNDTCNGATCQGTPLDCNDSNACTQDSCDFSTGQCVHQADPCDDRNACTTDVCDTSSGCSHTPLQPHELCDDAQPCTTNDRCDFGPLGFNCYGQPTGGTPCDDGSACTTDDACRPDGRGGAFCSGSPLECSDGNACTNDQCLSDTGSCRSMPVSCNDFNTCTDEVCSMQDGCQYTPHEQGSACDDLNPCSTGDVCSSGFCFGMTQVSCDDQLACTLDNCDYNSGGACLHVPRVCDDANPCTDDSCAEPDGTCLFTPRPDGTACSTQNACTTVEVCQSGQCTGTGTACDDGNPCTTDVCDPATGGCLFLPISCSDHNGCTADSCDPTTGLCRNEPISCDDGEFCTADTCNPAIGTCQHTPQNDGFDCDDGNACTQQTTCHAGTCGNGTPLVCNDGNQCTSDFCSPATGCVYTPAEVGRPCSDGSACTTQDRCNAAAQCVGVPKICNDGNTCTVETCNPLTGVCQTSVLPDGSACDDLNACTPGDQCQSGNCIGGPPPACSDGDACTWDSCDPATGGCRFLPIVCDDANVCTSDSCDPGAGCRYAPVPNGTACDDPNACVTGESCQYGQCIGATPNCDDGQSCTFDYCDSNTGVCQHSSNCNDNNPCTDDVCLPDGGCNNVWREAGSACDDGNVCTAGDVCVETGMGPPVCLGQVTPGAACDDQNLCTTGDTCLDFGAVSFCQGTDVACGDGEVCNIDFCDSRTGQCVHQPLNCNDGNPCTTDSCGPQEGQCSFQPVPTGTPCSDPSGCLIGGTCGPAQKGFACNGTPNIGAPCDDHNPCTERERCRDDGRGGAQCGGPGISCEDGLPCTADFCDAATGACHQTPAFCDDGDPCTLTPCSNETGTCTTLPAPLYEVSSLDFTTQTGFGWSATPSAVHWNAYRGTIPKLYMGIRGPGLEYDHVCLESADANADGALFSNDAEDPPLGEAFYYDATGEAGCGEGPLGSASSGAVRPNPSPCPTPP